MAASNPQIPKVIIFTLGSGTPKSFAEDLIDCAVVPAPGDVQSVLTLDGVTHQDTTPCPNPIKLTDSSMYRLVRRGRPCLTTLHKERNNKCLPSDDKQYSSRYLKSSPACELACGTRSGAGTGDFY